MASFPIRWIEGRVHCHATEDEARVLAALDAVCPGGAPEREVLEGHFGNPIVRLTRRLKGSEAVRSAWERWRDAGLLETIASHVDERVDDEGVLHLRFDKQSAYLGKLGLAKDADSIDVRLRLQAYPAKADAFRAIARSLVVGGT